MNSRLRTAFAATVVGVVLVLVPVASQAELIRVEIASRVDVLNGKAFGDVGPYEKIWGKAFFALDPANPRNQMIADIDLAVGGVGPAAAHGRGAGAVGHSHPLSRYHAAVSAMPWGRAKTDRYSSSFRARPSSQTQAG